MPSIKEEKIIRNLVHFANNEAVGLNKLRILKRISTLSGWTVLLVAFTLAFQQSKHLAPWIYTIAAAFGGALIGLAIWYENTLLTWPTLRRFLDLEKLKNYKGRPNHG